MPLRNFFILATLCPLILVSAPVQAADGRGPSQAEALEAMKQAATFYRDQVARHGGYVYFYSVDLQQRFGEGPASDDQIWVQPPGTPTVGMAYLQAFAATADPFYLDAATETADALIYGQLESGGWTNCIDFNPRGDKVARYRNGKGRGRNYSSLDDDQTQAAIRLLMRCDLALDFKNERIHQAAKTALAALLAAQFPNGAFPQVWDGPVPGDHTALTAQYPPYDWRTEGRVKAYWNMYTLNDGLAGSVSQVLIEAHEIYAEERFKASLQRLGDFLLLAQLPAPQPAWAQQYSYEMFPIWARQFEPAAVSGGESQDVLETLLEIYQYTGDAKYLKPVPDATAYLRRSRLDDGQLARFYELQTNRPLYMKRQGGVYSLTYDDDQLPDHYGWKIRSRLDAIETRFKQLRGDVQDSAKHSVLAPTAERAAEVIQALDAEGRWVEVYQGERLVGAPRFGRGYRYLSSHTFSKNLELLSRYVK